MHFTNFNIFLNFILNIAIHCCLPDIDSFARCIGFPLTILLWLSQQLWVLNSLLCFSCLIFMYLFRFNFLFYFSFLVLNHGIYQSCGSYFTSVLYVEHWCEDHFSYLTLGSPDFSHSEMVSQEICFLDNLSALRFILWSGCNLPFYYCVCCMVMIFCPFQLPRHIEILVSAITQVNEPDSLYGIVQSHKVSQYNSFTCRKPKMNISISSVIGFDNVLFVVNL